MKLHPIPVADSPVEHPRNPYIAERSLMNSINNFHDHLFHRHSLHEVQAWHDLQAERYAEGWVLAEAA